MKIPLAEKSQSCEFIGSPVWPMSRVGFVLLLVLVVSPGKAQPQGLNLETVWQKNVYSSVLRAPLLGAVAADGTLCLAMSQGREAVIYGSDGTLLAQLRADRGSVSNMVSITDLGYDAEGDVFWIWSALVRKMSRWDLTGKHLGTTSVAREVSHPAMLGKLKIYTRRPDQGSQYSLFSYDPELDEEILIWQPQQPNLSQKITLGKPPFVVGKQQLAVRDDRHLTLVHLDELRDDWLLPFPDRWFSGSQQGQGRLTVQSAPGQNRSIALRVSSNDQFWAFRPSAKGIGYEFAHFDGQEGVLRRTGVLESVPLAVDDQHVYFVDVIEANNLMLRKVRMVSRN